MNPRSALGVFVALAACGSPSAPELAGPVRVEPAPQVAAMREAEAGSSEAPGAPCVISGQTSYLGTSPFSTWRVHLPEGPLFAEAPRADSIRVAVPAEPVAHEASIELTVRGVRIAGRLWANEWAVFARAPVVFGGVFRATRESHFAVEGHGARGLEVTLALEPRVVLLPRETHAWSGALPCAGFALVRGEFTPRGEPPASVIGRYQLPAGSRTDVRAEPTGPSIVRLDLAGATEPVEITALVRDGERTRIVFRAVGVDVVGWVASSALEPYAERELAGGWGRLGGSHRSSSGYRLACKRDLALHVEAEGIRGAVGAITAGTRFTPSAGPRDAFVEVALPGPPELAPGARWLVPRAALDACNP